MKNRSFSWALACLFFSIMACSDDTPEPVAPPVGPAPPITPLTCTMNEIEFQDEEGLTTGVREFNLNPTAGNRTESVSVVQDTGDDVLLLRFQFEYEDDNSIVPHKINEIFGADVISTIDLKFDSEGNLSEFTQFQLFDNQLPPESRVFVYESSDLASDSINTRIIVFDIERLIRDWIDVFPALFTTGGQRITQFNRISFRGDVLEVCRFSYTDEGYLEGVLCRNSRGLISEIWTFIYEGDQLASAFHQTPDFYATTEYQYDADGKPASVISTTDGRFNWEGRYFYQCQ